MQEVAERLTHDYYDLLDALCANVDSHTREMLGHALDEEYIRHSNYLVEEVRGFVNERRNVYIPYVFELAEKKATGHNCSTCSGRCDMHHSLRLHELSASQKKIYDIANKTLALLVEQINHLPHASQVVALRNEATLLRNKISQLVDYEELFLVPGIKEAQKNINAHS